MSETKHTPTPWALGDAYDCGKGYAVCAGPQVIARVTGFGYPIGIGRAPESDANADFIVRACNSHEALCAALEDAYAHVTLLGCGEKPPLSDAEMCNLLGDALKLARGES